jgi:UDP-glucose 4-epimerase
VDLAKAHVKAIDYLYKNSDKILPLKVNIGTGKGYSVLDMVKAFEKVTNKKIPYKIAPRRAGDIATCYANPAYAREILGWEAKKTLEDMCADSWRWQSNNPNGYGEDR